MTTLRDLKIGETGTVVSVGGEGALRQHFLDMGIIPEADVKLIKYAPMGDPMELRIHGYDLTLRLDDAGEIEIRNIRTKSDSEVNTKATKTKKAEIEHPGLGENGIRYHAKADENPLPEGEVLTFALVGNQNCGKTTLFNQLTGSNQHVGNFPGVTVDRKDGQIIDYKNTLVTDLPGIYSMSPYSSEELVSREFIMESKPRGIINIVDATNIERNLYLTMQLMELDVPMVLALNMMDEVKSNGGSVLVNEMEEIHIRPFKEKADMIMVAHLHCTCFDKNVIPASLSKNAVGYLRNNIGYNVVVITDDMVMKGVQDFGAVEACIMAIEAGVDMFIYRNADKETIEIIEEVIKRVEKSESLKKQIIASNKRIVELKSKFL